MSEDIVTVAARVLDRLEAAGLPADLDAIDPTEAWLHNTYWRLNNALWTGGVPAEAAAVMGRISDYLGRLDQAREDAWLTPLRAARLLAQRIKEDGGTSVTTSVVNDSRAAYAVKVQFSHRYNDTVVRSWDDWLVIRLLVAGTREEREQAADYRKMLDLKRESPQLYASIPTGAHLGPVARAVHATLLAPGLSPR